ncbi:MAG: tRNA pseudouridine(38-40) synthase TruA [Planctomycetaceae bacterium]
MTVGYDGTSYCGWQVQPNGTTIQSLLERAIAQVCHERVRVTGSGRTDSGVHAIAQVASFSLATWRASAAALCRALNSKLPPDIAISEIIDAPQDFHAIRDAIGKRYRYQLQIGGVRDPFEYRFRWHVQGPIDCAAMRKAAAALTGIHDFASFQAAGADRKTTVRDVRELVITEQQGRAGGQAGAGGQGSRYLTIEIEADGFLYNMVRNIVGTLLEVGRGKQDPSWVADVLRAADRKQAGPTAPPHGLCLMRVDYAPF